MTTLYCAECRGRFEPDDNHTKVEAEIVRMKDRNGRDDYAFCPECWRKLSDEWGDPV